MRIQCDYCGQFFDDQAENCPFCGAVNNAAHRAASGAPQTIEELKAFAARHGLPLEKMRFFLGENYTGARAYGIYQDDNSGDFIVYKNKSDGSRAVRYRGKDEAYAVNELYQKMKAEVAVQKAHPSHGGSRSAPRAAANRPVRSGRRLGCLSWFLISFIALFVLSGLSSLLDNRFHFTSSEPMPHGYYQYGGTTYYPFHDDWYYWDDAYDDWYETDPPVDFTDNYDDYFLSDSYYDVSGADFGSFYDGSVYQEYSDSDYYDSDYYDSDYYDSYDDSYDYDDDYSSWDDDDWDSDWDWDSGSDWDSGWSDWDSDW